jgi:hypothetical protein
MKNLSLCFVVLSLVACACTRSAATDATLKAVDTGRPNDPWAGKVFPDRLMELQDKGYDLEQIRRIESNRRSEKCAGGALLTKDDPDLFWAACTYRERKNYHIKEYIAQYMPTKANEERLQTCVAHDKPMADNLVHKTPLPPELANYHVAHSVLCNSLSSDDLKRLTEILNARTREAREAAAKAAKETK